MAVGVALLPSKRGVMEVAALGAAVLCALQITLNYWLYPYIVWFFPMAMVALVAAHPDRRGRAERWQAAAAPVPPAAVPIRIASS
jgi:hypothetical protein